MFSHRIRSEHTTHSVSMAAAQPTALLVVAEGSEEVEFAGTFDVLVRSGVRVIVASCAPARRLECKLSRGLTIKADVHIDDVAAATPHLDAVCIPGGMPGAKNIAENARFIALLKQKFSSGGAAGGKPLIVAAICAAPAVALLPHRFLDGVKAATCFPALRAKLGGVWQDAPVVVETLPTKNVTVITSQGPGTTFKFALALASRLVGEEKAAEIAAQMLVSKM
jgi:4-methyl-5(b-hydroxyethyl)-thiazole monophosphate biosynthesis